jgi:hypothetical protein
MMRDEQPTDCALCWHEESLGLPSKRGFINSQYDVEELIKNTDADGTINTTINPIQYLDVRFGNLCNQACRSCGPSDSSLWYEDEIKKRDRFTTNDKKIYFFKKKGNSVTIDSDDFFWYDKPNFEQDFRRTAHTLDRIYFTGGEPTVNKAHFKTLDWCVELDVAKNITLEYNSNLMAIPDSLIERWSHFKHVNIGASIDAYGKLAPYVRYPSTWATVSKNYLRLDRDETAKISLSISSTISCLNVLNFLELARWTQTRQFKRAQRSPAFHMLHGPERLNVQILPMKTKKMIEQEYEKFFKKYPSLRTEMTPILTFMFAEDKSHLLRSFFETTFQLDRNRKQKLFTFIPWMRNVWDEFLTGPEQS